ncbi:peptide chain release factor N(5)-glutamine methyltransferase [Actinocrispum sp. NPDC049592]|uniref:peptide chain release factor N(5)-glutamine methyltransferase n=1 Tax=Actinocrispum sp. NPDC049592 TaxID=3154835 RepID=UPI0034472787
MTRTPLRLALKAAQEKLAESGVDSPRVDAELLASHVLGVERNRLPLIPLVDPSVVDALHRLVLRRAGREPLQYIIGTAWIGDIELAVGPGVFVPRPETDLLLDWAIKVAPPSCVVVDLCTGSGALALGFAHARPDAKVHAVEIDPVALSWARRNAEARADAGDRRIRLHSGDVTDPKLLADMESTVDVVLCNPPYVPDDTPVPPEVAEHDPRKAVFGGPDGLDVIKPVIACAARLLKPGGWVGIEHDDSQGESVPALLAARKVLSEATDHRDLAGRPRFATARRG